MDFAATDPATGQVNNYSVANGLQGREFNFGAHYRNPDGELFFGGLNGYNSFKPEELLYNQHAPPVVLTSFLRANQPGHLRTSESPPEENPSELPRNRRRPGVRGTRFRGT